jgi:FlaA1/EpsC-like NDP-sugar epimerase
MMQLMNSMDASSYKQFFEYVTGRKEVSLLENDFLDENFRTSRILIIGAAGSIGSAIALRLSSAKIQNVFFLDRDESSLHELSLRLSNVSAAHSDKFFIADIRDRYGVINSIEKIKPTIVIHAAALKHLVILEKFPREGFLTNILGTLNVAQICLELGVQQFINISTDKAANPTSILGNTKKLAELLTEEVYINSDTKQCSVRFGNVFASRGSVIETFIHQIQNGIPVTITDKNVTRFFMSQSEAADLVLASSSLKETGTYIQNMGPEVKIIDVVSRIASYLKLPYSTNIIGLQGGEKLQEELYDGPVTSTKYSTISKSVHSVCKGLVEVIRNNIPENDAQARNTLSLLVDKYIKSK